MEKTHLLCARSRTVPIHYTVEVLCFFVNRGLEGDSFIKFGIIH